MRSGSVSVHLVLDAKSVYNPKYDESKLQLALAHGTKLVNEFDRKIESSSADKPYQQSAFVGEILREMQNGMPMLTADAAVLQRLQKRTEALSAIQCKDQSSSKSALSVLKEYSEDMDKGYANFVTRLPAALQHQLFFQANQELIQNITNDVARGATVYVANGTSRQFMSHNAFEYLVHDTGCLFHDLQGLVSHLRAQSETPDRIRLDALTLHDALFDFPAGEHYKNVIAFITQFGYFSDCEHLDFVSTYLHAQYHANHHGDIPIELHCYVSTDEAAAKLKAQIVKYHDRLPRNVNIVVTRYCGNGLQTNACIGSADQPERSFRRHAKTMHKVLPNADVRDLPDAEDQYYVAMLDADNCIYNVYYFMLQTLLIEKFGDRLVASKELDKKSEEMLALRQEMLDFVRSYPSEKLFARDVNYRNLNKLRNELNAKFEALPLDKDIIAMRDSMLAVDSTSYDNNKHGPVFCQLVRMLAAYTTDIMTTIVLRANQELFSDMKIDAKDMGANKIALLISSMRQCYASDLKNAVWNGTGRFHLDLGRAVAMLNRQAVDGDPRFEYDDLTLVDYQYELAPGSHVNLSGVESHKALDILCVNEKLDTLYKDAHHAKRRYRVRQIDFFDDSIRIFEAIQAAYGEKDIHGLLPADLIIKLVGYNGKYMRYESCITGRGVVDHHPYHLFNYTSRTRDGFNALIHGQLDSLPYAREQAASAAMKSFFDLTSWSHPNEFHAPARTKITRKITRTIQVLEEEVEHFSACSHHVKHGIYAGKKPLPVREITALLSAIKQTTISPIPGLEKIMQHAANHSGIYSAAKKLRDLIQGANEEQFAHMQMTGLGGKRYV